MGYYKYWKTWTSVIGDILQCQVELDNTAGKYALAVMNKDRAVEHLMKEKSGKFAKIVFFFQRADVSNMATIKRNGKGENKGK